MFMKMSELRHKSPEELTLFLGERRTRTDELRFLLAQKKTKNVKEIAGVRKDIARIKTALNFPAPRS